MDRSETAGRRAGIRQLPTLSSERSLPRRLVHSIGQFAESAPLRFSLLAVLFLQALVLLVFRPSYATNDDVFITMIASGKGFCPAPDEHLIFTNVIIGTVLKQLYTAVPQIPWYGCYLLLVHLAAQVAVLYCALTIRGRNDSPNVGLRCGLYLLYYALVEIPLLNRFQFTTIAFLAAQAGIFLWLLAWQRRTLHSDAAVAMPLLASVVLVVLGGLIRFESLAMAVLVAGPVGLLFIRQFFWSAVLPCGVALATAAALVVGAFSYDRLAYENDPQWRGFREFNQLRGKFHDGRWTAFTPETASLFAEVGWSENDHAMIANWFSDDPVLFSEANLKKIVDGYPWSAARLNSDLWRQAFRDVARNRSVLSVLLALPFVLVLIPSGRAKLAIAGSALAAVALIALVTWSQKVPPERVYFPLLSFPLSVALLSFAWQGKADSAGRLFKPHEAGVTSNWNPFKWSSLGMRSSLVVGLLVAALVMGLYRQVRQTSRVQRERVALNEFLQELQSAEPKLCVSWEAALPYELVSPLDNLQAWSRIPLLSLAWTQRTPWHEEIKRQFGIVDLPRALYERNDVVLVATPLHRSLFTKFAKEHFGDDIAFEPIRESTSTFVAGSFHHEATPDGTAIRPIEAAQRK